MYRYYEYTDEDGKRWGAMQNAPDATRAKANELLMHTARVSKWKDIEVFKDGMPDWEIKRRINAVQQKNGNPLLYTEEETTDPALRPTISVPTIVLTDHHDGATIKAPVLPTSAARVMNEGIVGPDGRLVEQIPLVDHAEPSPAPAAHVVPPLIVPAGQSHG